VNTDELEQAIYMAERRVLEIQTKLHRWASDDPHRRFDDLYNLVTDPAFALVAWGRVRGNKGALRPMASITPTATPVAAGAGCPLSCSSTSAGISTTGTLRWSIRGRRPAGS